VTAPAVTPGTLALADRRLRDRLADGSLSAVTGALAYGVVLLVLLIAYELVDQAWPAITEFGLGFVTSEAWNPVTSDFGALDFIYGTALTSVLALIIAAPLAIAVALFLTELCPRALRGVISTLVELLAALPSVVIGLWGIFVLGPFLQEHIDPFLQSAFGWTGLFTGTPQLTGYLTAALVLTIMVLPISAAVAQELFRTVPPDLKEASYALGSTRWETIRGVVIPYTRGGLVAAVILGLGRAIGEAIAVTQVIGGTLGISASLFANGDTLASRIAAQYQAAATNIHIAALVYLALVLLVISLAVNFTAQLIVRRFDRAHRMGEA
jgi:phosphate transport system permease protein